MKKRNWLYVKSVVFIALALVIVLHCDAVKGKVSAEKDYTYVETDDLEEIKNNSKALAQVRYVSVVGYEREDAEKIKKQLMLISKCPNLEYVYACVNGLHLDKEFFNSLPSTSPEIEISLQWCSLDFQGVDNSNVNEIYLTQTKITHFEDIVGFRNLEAIVTDSAEGICIADFDKLEHLERVSLRSQRIDDYKQFFEKVRNVKELSLLDGNLQNSDLTYLKGLQNLTSLQIAGTLVDDASALRDCPNLTFLGLPYGLDDLSFLYDLPNLSTVEFDAYTELFVDENLVRYFEENDVWFPDFDRDISKKVQKIVDSLGITKTMTDREKAERVTEYVLLNMVGDEEELTENLSNPTEGTGTILSYDVNVGAGICHWYAILEYTLLKCVGIDAYYVEGYALLSEDDTPGAHAWNEVRIDGEWYGIDPLWMDDDNNDPTTPEYKDFAWRLYFLKPTKTDDYHDFPQYADEEEYMDKYFALQHRTMNDPQDTIPAGGKKKEVREETKPGTEISESTEESTSEVIEEMPDSVAADGKEEGMEKDESKEDTKEKVIPSETESDNHLIMILGIVAFVVILLSACFIAAIVVKKKGTKKES